MSDPILTLSDVVVAFDALRAVDGVSLTVPRGQRRAIIGPNGAGKTTLFNAIAGALPPTAGRIAFDGHDITRLPPHRRARLGVSRTFQITNLFPRLSVRDNMVLALRGRSPRKFSLFGTPEVDAVEGPQIAAALEAVRIATKYRTPVIILSDGYLANGSEPWRIPDPAGLPKLRDEFSFSSPGEWKGADGKPDFRPYQRNPETLARPWAIPGTPGLEHRIGGIEKADGTGTISYDAGNHDRMVRLRQAKVDGIAADIGPLAVDDPDGQARVLVLGWGSTFGSIGAAVRRIRVGGGSVAQAHLRNLSPFPANLGDVLSAYDKVLVPEINLGQLALLLRGRYLVDVISYNRVRGLPFRAAELAGVIQDVIDNV